MRVIITGGNSGVGKATATALAAQGHSVVIACRTIDKGRRVAAEMPGDVEVRPLDLTDLASVRAFADSVETVDVLVNNAGVMGMPLTRTVDGFEAHMGTNHLGHFALTCLLGDRIKDRVVSVASATYLFTRIDLADLNWHTRKYSKWSAYGQSKLANLLFVHELAARGIRAYATDPGATNTDITRSLGMAEHRADTQASAYAGAGRASQPPSRDDRSAQRYLSGAALQSVRPAEGDQVAAQGDRSRRWPAGCGTCPRS